MNATTTGQVAERFGVQVQTVSGWCKRDLLPGAEKLGDVWLIPKSALESFVQPQRGRPPKDNPEAECTI